MRRALCPLVLLAVLLVPVAGAQATVPKETYTRLKALDDTLNRIRNGVANQNLDTLLLGGDDDALGLRARLRCRRREALRIR